MKKDRQSAVSAKGKHDQDGMRTELIAAMTAILVGLLSSGVTYLTTRSTLHSDEVIQQQNALRSACLDALRFQEGEISVLGDMLNYLTILNDFKQFQQDAPRFNSLQTDGQDAELYLAAPNSVREHVSAYADTVNDFALPALLLRLGGIPSTFRETSPEAADAVKYINIAQENIARIGAACREALT